MPNSAESMKNPLWLAIEDAISHGISIPNVVSLEPFAQLWELSTSFEVIFQLLQVSLALATTVFEEDDLLIIHALTLPA